MSSASSSSDIGDEERKRKAHEANLDVEDDSSRNEGASSSSTGLKILKNCESLAENAAVDSADSILETAQKDGCTSGETLSTDNGGIVAGHDVSDAGDVDDSGKEGADGTSDTPPNIIQIDFFEESSHTSSLSVDFLSSRSSLYGIVETLFEYFLEDRLQEAIYSHVWIIKVNKSRSYVGPFPESTFAESQVRTRY